MTTPMTEQPIDENETNAEAAAEGAAEGGEAAPTPRGRPMGAAGMLSRPSDFVARPGFRNPANAGSKAQKKTGKKRR